jgi:hypothetical protein
MVRGKPDLPLRVGYNRTIALYTLGAFKAVSETIFSIVRPLQPVGDQTTAFDLKHMTRGCDPEISISVFGYSEHGFTQRVWHRSRCLNMANVHKL